MTYSNAAQAAILAATEVVPADWRDLSTALESCGGPEALITDSYMDDDCRSGLMPYLRSAIDPARLKYWERKLAALAKRDNPAKFIAVTDREYPQNLRQAFGRPPFIFVAGSLQPSDSRSIAIVGSRDASELGLGIANKLAADLASSNVTVVSGLARGIDAAAHQGAIMAGGRTLAVVATGIDHPPSKETDASVAKLIPGNGAVISRFRPGSPPSKSSFVLRNSVISGLSLASVIVEAGERSGTRTEADFAIQQGRKVLLWEPSFRHQRWIKTFAQNSLVSMVDSTEGVLEVLGEG
ncbi:DNA-protecting protein DprA [Dactylosporangium vinaceum]|uniref:DNA-processing protein DprA n=1 Tax=Dactylosporangium vinaceum TaxID=53362 RepID=A0ABV5LZ00_9ACTN|nr:DNA-processing protein DprA [Dactylosporangium vinaceum]UAB95190.1 DNA-protecting protein DprA [Dactylosporangium vinaceum]